MRHDGSAVFYLLLLPAILWVGLSLHVIEWSPLIALALAAVLTVLALLALQYIRSRKKRELLRVFEGAGLVNRVKQLPTILKVEDKGRYSAEIRLPPGMSTGDFQAKQQAIEEFLCRKINIEFEVGKGVMTFTEISANRNK